MTISNYGDDWASAIERTKRYNLRVPTHELTPTHRYLNSSRYAEFPFVVQKGLGELDYPDVVAQCLSIHYRLVPILEEWLGCPVLYTLGWIDDGSDKGMFKFDESFIAGKLRDGHHERTVNIHAWLTLPSFEVIDLALVTSLAVLKGWDKGHGSVLAKHADEITGLAYKPMLIGADFLRYTGIMRLEVYSPA